MSPPRVELAPGYSIPRIVAGGWQLSRGHSATLRDPRAVLDLWHRLVDLGFDAFDCADIYQGVEELLGRFLRERADRSRIRVHTKYVPDRSALPSLTREAVAAAIERSCRRLGVERLDLVQFHWWDYAVPGYTDTIGWLADLARAGAIRLLGVTNFDAPRLEELLATGAPIASIQLQYSVLDRRPRLAVAELCRRHGIALLAYGTVAGGFLSDRWLGAPAPGELENRSLVKYRLIVNETGGWERLQRALAALSRVARRHDGDVASAATAWTLAQPGVAAAIVGVRSERHLPALARAAGLRLDPADLEGVEAAMAGAPGPAGDVYTLERDAAGPHAAIMRYDLNREDPIP